MSRADGGNAGMGHCVGRLRQSMLASPSHDPGLLQHACAPVTGGCVKELLTDPPFALL